MFKIIFDKTTGEVVATCMPQQDSASVLTNYSNVDIISTESLPGKVEINFYKVDLESRTLITKS